MKKLFKEEIKIIILYLIIGLSWIYFSDKILYALTDNLEFINQFQSYKGVFYVITTAILFYLILHKYIEDFHLQKKEARKLNEQLRENNEELLAMNQELDQSFEELNSINQRFIKMINIVSTLDKQNNFVEEDFLSDLLKSAVEIIPEADYGKIYLLEDGYLKFIDAVGHDINSLKKLNLKKKCIYHYQENDIFNSKDYSINLDNVQEENKKELKKALKDIKDSIYINITVNDNIVGRISLDIAADSVEEFKESTKNILNSFAILASAFFSFKHYNTLQNKFTKEVVSSIIRILEIYDRYTKGHSENVANLAAKIAAEMKLSKNLVSDTYWAGMIHDLGKLLVPINILNKKEKLTKEEFQLIKKHPIWGKEALSKSGSLKHISTYILYHHERWDGKGYPEGLKGENIPLVSQIISVADAWDAMRSKRSYRKPLTKKVALNEIKQNKGKQFSPQVVDAFLKLAEKENLYQKDYQLDNSNFNINESYFQSLFEKSKQGIVILDNRFKIIKSNQHFLKMFGFKKHEILDKHIKNIVVPIEKSEETDKFINQVKNNERVSSRTYRQKKNGASIEVSIEAFQINLDKNSQGYYIIYEDISELKNIERKFRNSQQKYRTLFENDDVVMLIIDPEDGKIIDANPAAENFYGWDKKKLKEMKISEINTLNRNEIKAEMDRARSNNKTRFLFKHKTASGKIKDVEVYSQPIHFEDKKYLYSIIHESKKSLVFANSY